MRFYRENLMKPLDKREKMRMIAVRTERGARIRVDIPFFRRGKMTECMERTGAMGALCFPAAMRFLV